MSNLSMFLLIIMYRFISQHQSFDQALLEGCGRAHGLAEVEAALHALHTAGVDNWSMDLISGIIHLCAA